LREPARAAPGIPLFRSEKIREMVRTRASSSRALAAIALMAAGLLAAELVGQSRGAMVQPWRQSLVESRREHTWELLRQLIRSSLWNSNERSLVDSILSLRAAWVAYLAIESCP
jgi:hypothetical protein